MAKKKASKTQLGNSIGSTLSRGRGSVIPTRRAESENFAYIPYEQLEANKNQPRRDFDEEALNDLASSIKVHGVIQPITVRKISPKKYQIISGERRYRASKIAGLEKIPAFILKIKEGEEGISELMEKALIENIQREDLNPIEVATSLYELKHLDQEKPLTDAEVAAKIGKARSTLTGYWRVYRLINIPNSNAIRESLRNGELSMGHAKALGQLGTNEAIENMFEQTISESWSVRQTEQAVAEFKEATGKKQVKKAAKESLPAEYQTVLDDLRKRFGSRKINLKLKKDGKGQIVLPFGSTEELNRFLDVIEGQ